MQGNSKITSKRGAVLITTFIIMAMLTTVTVGFLYMTSIQTRASGYDMTSSEAFWLAEAGMQRYMYLLANGTYNPTNHPTLNGTLGNGSYFVQPSYDEDTSIYILTSTGTVDVMNRKIAESVRVISTALERAMHADGAHLKLSNSSGIIDGNISCFVSVMGVDPDILTITGDITQGAEQDKIFASLPLGPGTTYYMLADDAEQVSTAANTIFNNAGSPYSGVWYATNKVTIESNTTINGTIVAEGNISFEKGATNVTISPGNNYPALYTGGGLNIPATTGKTKIGLQNSTIRGLILADTNITIDRVQNTATFTGTLLAGSKVDMENGAINMTYNAGIFDPMPLGFTFSGGTATVTPQKDWNEIVPAT